MVDGSDNVSCCVLLLDFVNALGNLVPVDIGYERECITANKRSFVSLFVSSVQFVPYAGS
jgi:hypothetical protein